jgi:hypothetical protein
MNSKILFKALLIVFGITLSIAVNAQETQGQTYTITSNGTVGDIQPYIDALSNSDMKYHRLKNTRNTIVFETGVSVELYSATEINNAVRPLNLSEYPESFPANRDLPEFSLGPNNFIMEKHHVTSKYH